MHSINFNQKAQKNALSHSEKSQFQFNIDWFFFSSFYKPTYFYYYWQERKKEVKAQKIVYKMPVDCMSFIFRDYSKVLMPENWKINEIFKLNTISSTLWRGKRMINCQFLELYALLWLHWKVSHFLPHPLIIHILFYLLSSCVMPIVNLSAR